MCFHDPSSGYSGYKFGAMVDLDKTRYIVINVDSVSGSYKLDAGTIVNREVVAIIPESSTTGEIVIDLQSATAFGESFTGRRYIQFTLHLVSCNITISSIETVSSIS